MKTFKGIRIGMMSLLALLVFSYTSRAFAAVDAFIWFSDDKGAKTKVKINDDGTFTTPPMHVGTYSWSFGATQSTIGSATSGAGSGRAMQGGTTGGLTTSTISGHSMSSGGDHPSESISLNFTKIIVTYSPQSSQSSRDAASGMASGKRMHKPITVTAEVDRSSSTATFGSVSVDVDGDTFSGSVVAKDKSGNTVDRMGWDLKQGTK